MKKTPETMKRFHALYESGLHDGEIAEQLGVHLRTVVRWRKENGMPSKCGVGRARKREKRNESERRKKNAAYLISLNRCAKCQTQDAFTLNGRHYCAECGEKQRSLPPMEAESGKYAKGTGGAKQTCS